MRTSGNYADVIGVFIDGKVVYGRQAIEIRRSWRVQFHLGADVDFVPLPCFDGNRAGGRRDECDCAAVSEAPAIVARSGAL